ncbi:rubrerythrin family protein [Niameybacter massiliensis]|uniref:Rubrerythrin family protein n=1 Tax=Holtiella tumoricola TaxID=3018743 RepID=A0AA42DQ44_9FIRM|nr:MULTISPECIES: ferritin family protein [Lachnospirales]MDA3732681.1 rubrerythrin family protein [Holtiella tumoricola]
MNLKGTQTEKNLKAALAGESMARNRYTFFAERAREEGIDEAAEFFERLAKNEKEHARLWFKLLYGEALDTMENMKIAAQGEHEEWTDMYVRFADQAREEGFHEIAKLFTEVKRIERNHERENIKIMQRIQSGEEKKKEVESNLWVCGHCGFSIESSDRLEACPLCKHTIIGL